METFVDSVAPQALLLPNQNILLVFATALDTCEIRDVASQQYIQLSGSFSEGVLQLLQGKPGQSERLRFLEKQHVWLQGLSQAKPVEQDMLYTVIGESLGMFFVELTSQCNEKCVHCYADSAPERTDFLGFKEIKQVLNEARALGRPYVQFTGGDPLIHRDLIKVLAHAHSLDFEALEVYTNGLLLSDDLLSKMKPYQPKIAFSMYSHLPETHDLITRVKGSHKRTCQAIQRAQEAGFTVRVSVILMQENKGQENKTALFLQDELGLSPDMIKFHLSRDIGRGKAFTPSVVEHASEREKSVNKPRALDKVPEVATPKARTGKLCVSATGDVFPCVFSRNKSMGNIKVSSLNDVLMRVHAASEERSATRWKSCQEQLSCGDCQLVTYAIGG